MRDGSRGLFRCEDISGCMGRDWSLAEGTVIGVLGGMLQVLYIPTLCRIWIQIQQISQYIVHQKPNYLPADLELVAGAIALHHPIRPFLHFQPVKSRDAEFFKALEAFFYDPFLTCVGSY